MMSYKNAVEIVEYTFTQTDIQVITLRGLSTENTIKRSAQELDFLMNMYKLVDEDLDRILIDNQVNFKRIGNPVWITTDFVEYLNNKQTKTACKSNKYFVFAINYGGKNEIVRAVQSLAKQGKDCTNITEQDISQACDLGSLPPVELVVRTKGDIAQRTSGFMSWWIDYAELYFTPAKCPEFSVPEFQQALQRFQTQANQRNYGK